MGDVVDIVEQIGRVVDWEAIEAEYRSGQMSIRAIAREHLITDMAVRDMAKRRGWTRDVSTQVRQATKAKVASHFAPLRTSQNRTSQKPPCEVAKYQTDEDEIIDSASDRAVAVVEDAIGRACRLAAETDRQLAALAAASDEVSARDKATTLRALASTAESVDNTLRRALSLDEPAVKAAVDTDQAVDTMVNFMRRLMSDRAKQVQVIEHHED